MGETGPAPDELILRDYLAIDRTRLANERTLLAYLRTALALVATGIGLIHFFVLVLIEAAGWLLILTGLVVVGIGTQRYRRTARRISSMEAHYGQPD